MDMAESIQPRSDQINADDLIGGPITYTIREVVQGKAEAPFDFLLVETDRAYRPSKTMRKLIVFVWGGKTEAYAGRRLTLYREPSITFGREKVGGIRFSHASHIDGPKETMLQTSRGKREKFIVQPLPDAPKHVSMGVSTTEAHVAACDDLDDLRQMWREQPNLRPVIEARIEALKAVE